MALKLQTLEVEDIGGDFVCLRVEKQSDVLILTIQQVVSCRETHAWLDRATARTLGVALLRMAEAVD